MYCRINEVIELKSHKKERVGIHGRVEIIVKDIKSGRIIQRERGGNVITTAAKTLTAKWFADTDNCKVTHCAIGTGSTAEDAAQTALVTEVDRKGVGFITSSAAVVTSETSFGSLEANGNTLYEAGLFTAASAGTMYSRYKFASSVNKTAGVELIVKWTITYS